MQQFSSILLEVWQEACRHIEIGESAGRIARLLHKHLPLKLLLVRRLDVQKSSLETVATGLGRDEPPPTLRPTTAATTAEMENLLSWCRKGHIFGAPGGAAGCPSRLIAPEGLTGRVLAGPLNGEEGPIGLLLLAADQAETFSAKHVEVLRALLDPFAIALENDRRLREMNVLRQAAEADRHALLAKLGRQNISENIVGADTGLRPVMERVELVARSDLPVLIFGETGSGKEVIARAIHTRSGRAAGPFLRVNCGALPPELIDSELFGHERGSFTGAVNMRKGWFERADGGSLFLDEVGELPPAAQVRLLRILQDGTFERVGGQQVLKVDVRVVAATHRDLPAMMADGRFREDLWYRLAVFPIELPALRDRPEDIPPLATHFAMRASLRFGLPTLVPTPEDMNLLVAYSWPGNARELAAVIDRAAILGNGRRLEIGKALGGPAAAAGAGEPAATAPEGAGPPDVGATFPTLETVMRRHIVRALERAGGRIEGPRGTAKLLRINPHTLRARMRKLRIDWKRYRAVEAEVEE